MSLLFFFTVAAVIGSIVEYPRAKRYRHHKPRKFN